MIERTLTKVFALLLLLTQISACGSMRGKTHYASVDSKPRGVTVYDRSGEELGETPLFHKTESRSQMTYDLDQGGAQNLRSVDCEFQWLQTSLENLPLPLILIWTGPPIAIGVYASAILTDTLTGAAYQCPERVKFEDLGDGFTVKRHCPKYLIAGLPSLSDPNEISSDGGHNAHFAKLLINPANDASYRPLKITSLGHIDSISGLMTLIGRSSRSGVKRSVA